MCMSSEKFLTSHVRERYPESFIFIRLPARRLHARACQTTIVFLLVTVMHPNTLVKCNYMNEYCMQQNLHVIHVISYVYIIHEYGP